MSVDQTIATLEMLDVVLDNVPDVEPSLDHRYALIGLDLDEVLEGDCDAGELFRANGLQPFLPTPSAEERDLIRAAIVEEDVMIRVSLALENKVGPTELTIARNELLAEAGFKFSLKIQEHHRHFWWREDGAEQTQIAVTGYNWECTCGSLQSSPSWTHTIQIHYTGNWYLGTSQRVETLVEKPLRGLRAEVLARGKAHRHKLPKNWVTTESKQAWALRQRREEEAQARADLQMQLVRERANQEIKEARERAQRAQADIQEQHLRALKACGQPGAYERAYGHATKGKP